MGKPPSRAGKYDDQEIEDLLRFNEARLAECDKEPYGIKFRGRMTMYRMMRHAVRGLRGLKKYPNRRSARREISRLLFQRHALRNGAMKLSELNNQAYSRSFLGYNYVKQIPFREGQLIILEMWRYGKSERLEHYQRLQAEFLKRRRARTKRKVLASIMRENTPPPPPEPKPDPEVVERPWKFLLPKLRNTKLSGTPRN